MTWPRRTLISLAVGLLLFTATGCWDEQPDTMRASALIMTVEPASQAGQWRWGFYFPNPTVTVSSLSQLKRSQQLYSLSVVAPSLYEAYTRVQQRLARDLYLGQLEVIIVSSKVTAQEFRIFLNAYNRDGSTPKTAYLLVTSGPLATMASVTPQESIPAVYWASYFQCRQCQPEFLAHPVWKVWDSMVTPGTSPIVPYGTAQFQLAQIAVYPLSGRPIVFNRQQTRGLTYLTGRTIKETLTIMTPWGRVAIGQIHGTAHSSAVVANNHIRVAVRIKLSATLGQWESLMAMTPRMVKGTETMAEQSVLSDCLAAIKEANMTHTDPFGYGRQLYFSHAASPTIIEGGWEPIDATVSVILHIGTTGSGV